jgi:hypothetical protein
MRKKRKPGSDLGFNQTPAYIGPEYNDEDIYSKEEKEPFIEEGSDATLDDDTTETETVLTGEDLDAPGAEIDDANEEIGEEDEENNYYSLGGDNHDDLEEGQG